MGEYYWHDFVGNVGVFLILLCYLLLQIENMKSDGVLYSALNGIGAVLILCPWPIILISRHLSLS